jgi:hypothetical protein
MGVPWVGNCTTEARLSLMWRGHRGVFLLHALFLCESFGPPDGEEEK